MDGHDGSVSFLFCHKPSKNIWTWIGNFPSCDAACCLLAPGNLKQVCNLRYKHTLHAWKLSYNYSKKGYAFFLVLTWYVFGRLFNLALIKVQVTHPTTSIMVAVFTVHKEIVPTWYRILSLSIHFFPDKRVWKTPFSFTNRDWARIFHPDILSFSHKQSSK